MKRFGLIPILTLLLAVLGTACTTAHGNGNASSKTESAVIDHVVESLDGEQVDLSTYRGKAILIVNTASKCGFTPQYADLQAIYEKYAERGLVVIGFPSNDFGNQEPGDSEEIADFCKKNYGVTFPMMAKVHAKGSGKAPIYVTLTEQTTSSIQGEVRWNFTKFLVDPEGHVVGRFESSVKPTSKEMTQAIEAVLPG